MCLCGVDYFSTLGYQPSIAFEGAGTLAPLATLVLVLVTLFGAYPVYSYVAGQTPDGVGSIGMIERLVSGWKGKIGVLVLIGFAATDFVITKTLSAADAAAHLISNSIFAGNAPPWAHNQVAMAVVLLLLLGAMFLKGYSEVVGIATVLVIVFLGAVLCQVLIGLFLHFVIGLRGASCFSCPVFPLLRILVWSRGRISTIRAVVELLLFCNAAPLLS